MVSRALCYGSGYSGLGDNLVVVRFGVSTEYFVIATSFPGEDRLLPILTSAWGLGRRPDYG